MTPSQRAATERLRTRLAERRKTREPLPPRQEAEVEALRAFVRIASKAVYSAACPDPKGIELFLDPAPQARTLGEGVRAALAASRFLDPSHPEFDAVMRFPMEDELKARDARLMERAGVKTSATLYRGAGLVSAVSQDGTLSLKPWRYLRGGNWGSARVEPGTIPEAASDEQLGAAVLAEIERSRAA
jgi:hypothetical protein